MKDETKIYLVIIILIVLCVSAIASVVNAKNKFYNTAIEYMEYEMNNR